jgi:heme-degrading monooxygenase HmoA
MTAIVRTWMAYAKPENVRAYRDHLNAFVLPALNKLPGFLGLDLCQAARGDRVELLVISRWESMNAVKAFAGPNPDRAVVEPGAKAVLAEYDDFASHYEVALEATGSLR